MAPLTEPLERDMRISGWVYTVPPEPGLVLHSTRCAPRFAYWWMVVDVHPGRLPGRYRLSCLRWPPSDACPVDGVEPREVMDIYRGPPI